VRRTIVQGDGTLEELADRLWQQLDQIDGPLILLCHSMGGLQARTFLLDDNRARRLHAIATVGSPHRGTALTFASWLFNPAYRSMTPPVRDAWLKRHEAEELRTARRHGVRCLSAVAALRSAARYPQLIPTQAFLQLTVGPNDGLVSAASQRWGETVMEVDLDHIESVGVFPPARRARPCHDLWIRLAETAAGAQSAVG
jgi:pimeloyl-ACP methyl ester carboxylesterase